MQDVSPQERGEGPPDKPTAAGRFLSLSPRITLVEVAVILGIFLVLLAMLLPSVEMSREEFYSVSCMNNLAQLAGALEVYDDRWRCMPAAYVADADGQRRHSWRAQLLSCLQLADLAAQYHWDESWDSDANAAVAQTKLEVFCCPAARPTLLSIPPAHYFAVVGEGAAWPPGRSAVRSEITDGLAQTLFLAESSRLAAGWVQPQDLETPTLPLTINPARGTGISSEHQGGAHLLLADGSVRFLKDDVAASVLSALLTVAGGEVASVAGSTVDLPGPRTVR